MSRNWKKDIVNYGIVHARSIMYLPEDVTPPDRHTREREAKKIAAYRSKEQADICLTCPKETCSGTDYCFKQRRKMMRDLEAKNEAMAADLA